MNTKNTLPQKKVCGTLQNLPENLAELLSSFSNHCVRKNLKKSSIAVYEKEVRWFLVLLAEQDCKNADSFETDSIITACLGMSRPVYWTTIKTFLRYLCEAGYTAKDFSYVVPHYRRPEKIPSVYSVEEIRRIEVAISKPSLHNKRDLAAFMLASRLGLRAGDITTLTFDELDFDLDRIELKQDKTDIPLVLPLLSEIKEALLDCIRTERPKTDSPYVFLNSLEPYGRMTVQGLDKYISAAMDRAGIVSGERSRGVRAFRSSIASSMVNDGIPYEAVRRTLGHRDFNVIRHYAKLDIWQLRRYAVKPPEATGQFARFLGGVRV